MSEYDELLSFLTSSRVDLQEETLKVILHLLQSSPEGSVQYFKEDSRMDIFINLLKVPALASYTINILNLLITFLPTVTESSLIPATTSLDTLQTSSSTSISTNHQLFPSQQYSDQIMTILLTYLFTSTNSSLLNISLALLNNLTIPMENAELFISKVLNNPNIFQKLLNKFLEYNPQLEEDHEPASFHELDPWQYFSSVLCNLCRDERIQLFLLNKSTNNMVLLSKQIRSKNPVRRRGVVGSIRSCLFKSDFHWWLVEELNITTPLLLPLVVNTPFTDDEKLGMDPILWMQGPNKLPDSDYEIQKLILESFLILCQTRIIRERLRVRKVYPILRNLDYYQDNEEISSAIYEVVSQLIGNEDPSNPLSINKEVAGNGEEKNEMNSVDSSRQVVEEVGEENNPLDEVD